MSHLKTLLDKKTTKMDATLLPPTHSKTMNVTSLPSPVVSSSTQISLESGHQMYCLEGNRIINLINLKIYINIISEHSITCGNKVELIEEKMREGLASTLVSYCTKCEENILLASTPKVSIGGSKSSMYDVNIGAVLGHIYRNSNRKR